MKLSKNDIVVLELKFESILVLCVEGREFYKHADLMEMIERTAKQGIEYCNLITE